MGPTLGATRDEEPDGTHSAAADADGADEDGVTFGAIQVGALDATVTVNVQNAPAGAKLDGWMDFNVDGNWGGPGEHIFASVDVADGDNVLGYDVPSWAQSGSSYARFRISTAGQLGVVGRAADGEVEDYQVAITPPVAASGVFGEQNVISTSADWALSIYASDMDGDGDMDLLSASHNDNKIAWHENDGDENFTSHTITTSAVGAYSVNTTDLDGDGDMDVLSASSGKIAWYENDGDENFTLHTITTSVNGARSVYVADLDEDGDMDVLSASSDDDKIAWYENDGDENFTPHIVTTSADHAFSVYASDVDSDGDVDILSASAYDDKIAWYENDGDENFSPHIVTTSADRAISVHASDVDGDGDVDILSASVDDDKIAWYENNGSESFTPHTITTDANAAIAVFAADVDGDGDMDVFSASEFDNKIAWYENTDGTGNTFTAHIITTSANGARSVYVADVDSDGDLDVLSASFNDDKIAWYENNATPTLDAVADVTILEDAPQQTVALTGITAGEGESQVIGVTASSDNPGLIPNPAVTYPADGWMTDGLVAHYPFDGNATDASGNGHDAVVSGASLTTDRFGHVDSAYEFDGIDDVIKQTDASLMPTGQQDFTLSIWANPNHISGDARMFVANERLDEFQLSLYLDPKIELYLNGHPQPPAATDSLEWELGDWYHVVVTKHNDNVTFYRDGNLLTSVPYSGTSNTPQADRLLSFGNRKDTNGDGNGDHPWNGKLDDIRIYTRALSDDEVAQLYTQTSGTGTLHFTPMADQSGTATITVTVEDGGPDDLLATPGDNATESRTFDVTVNPVNDDPTLDAISNPDPILEDAPQQTISLTGITAGPGESQPLAVTATSSNPALIPNPTVTYTSAADWLTDGLVAHYPFDGDANNKADNAYHGDVVGATPTADRFGNPSSAYNFDGGDQISVDISSWNWDSSSTQTVSLWASFDSFASNSNTVLQTGGGVGTFTHEFGFEKAPGSDLLNLAIGKGSGERVHNYGFKPNFGEWHNYSFTYADGYSRRYVDGVLTGVSDQFTLAPPAATLLQFSGQAAPHGSSEFFGQLDDVRIYDRALTADEVAQLYTHNDSSATPEPTAVTITSTGIPTTGLPGYTTYTVRATSDAGPINGIDITFTGAMNHVNPCMWGQCVATIFNDNNEAITGSGGHVSQDSQFLFTSSDLLHIGAAEGPALLKAAITGISAHTGGATSVDFAQIVIPDGSTVAFAASFDNGSGMAVGASGTIPPPGPFGSSTGSLAFSPVADQTGTATITVTVEDGGLDNNLATSEDNATFDRTFDVTVNEINDPPVVTSPVDTTVNEDTDLAAEGFTVFDLETTTSESLVATLTAANGTLSLAATTGLTFTVGDGTVDTTMEFTGTAAHINAALETVTYRGNQDFFGEDTVTLTVNDQGQHGAGGPQQTTGSLTVTVTPVNDDPTLDALADVTTLEDAPEQTVNLTGITAGGGETQPLSVTATSSNPGLIPNPAVSYTSGNLPTVAPVVITSTGAPTTGLPGYTTYTVRATSDAGPINGIDITFTGAMNHVNPCMWGQCVATIFNDNNEAITGSGGHVSQDSQFLFGSGDILSVNTSESASELKGAITNISAHTEGATSVDFAQIVVPDGSTVAFAASFDNGSGIAVGASGTLGGPTGFAGSTGSLAFTPAADQTGTATITVTVEDGGLDNDLATTGDNASFSRDFVVTVNPVDEFDHDYGDAPAPYPVTLAENGARHNDTGPTLGAARDEESDGTHSAAADADGADEDGVTFGAIQVGALDATVTVNVQNAPAGAKLDGWIDFNHDGSWGGPGEQIFASVDVADGDNELTFDVPSWAQSGSSYARFRISTAGDLGIGGPAADGEVEDYAITIAPSVSPVMLYTFDANMDGDVPDSAPAPPDYTLSKQANGASYAAADLFGESPIANKLGNSGRMSIPASGDNNFGFWLPKTAITELSAWTVILWANRNDLEKYDFLFYVGTGDGFSGTGSETYVFGTNSQALRATNYSSSTATWDISGGEMVAKQWHQVAFSYGGSDFDLYLDGNLVANADNASFDGLGKSGNSVIVFGAGKWMRLDHMRARILDGLIDQIEIYDSVLSPTEIAERYEAFNESLAVDYSDAPAPYPVTLAENGARHTATGPTLGATRDDEADGTHSAAADADGADEDGVTFGAIQVGALDATVIANVQNAPAGAKLDGWIDFNADGSWGGPGEHIFASVDVTDGDNELTFDVPSWAVAGTTYARFRTSTAGQLGIGGAAADGEVEDYQVTIIPPVAASGTFGGQNVISATANGARSVFTADVDGDGDMDVLTSSNEADKVAWYENDGNENFTPHTISTDTGAARIVFAADVDSDGDIDVLSASQEDDKIAWYENDGSQNFTDRVISTTAVNAHYVFASDVDSDGDIDVLSASADDDKIAWYENDGSQNFTERVISTTADNAQSVFAADVDSDGDIDVLSASQNDDKVAWYENDGSQNFAERVISTAADGAEEVFAADVDGDGDIDVLSASTFADKIAWHENDGSQNFTERVISTVADQPGTVFAADVDGDGDIDVFSSSRNDDKIAWYENDGSQNFTERVVSTAANGARSVFAADVDGDGDIDVLSASSLDDKIAWYENNATPMLDPVADVTILEDAAEQTVNLTGITAGGSESQVLSVTATSNNPGLIPNPTVTYTSANDWLTDGLVAHYPFDGDADDESGNGHDAVVSGAILTTDRFGDANSAHLFDGVDDYIRYQGEMITANPFTWSVWFNLNNPVTPGNQKWLMSQADDPGSNKVSPTLTIIDGTLTFGSYDFGIGGRTVADTKNVPLNSGTWYHAVTTSDSSGNRNLYVNGELAGSANWSQFGQVLNNTYFGVRGGLNLNENVFDGVLDDIRIYDRALTAEEVAQLYTHTGTTGSLAFTPVADQHGTATITVTVEDGGLDNNLATPDDNATFSRDFAVTVTPGPSGAFAEATNFSVGSNPGSVAVGDFNSDGRQDLAVANAGSNSISILIGDGTGAFGNLDDLAVGDTPTSVAVGNFNGDQHQDLVVANFDDDNVSILLGIGNGLFAAAVGNFAAGDQPQFVVVDDFNNDGNQDLAVANQYTSTVSILTGDGTGSFAPPAAVDVGHDPRSIAVGDFNGDDNPDLAVVKRIDPDVTILIGNGHGAFGVVANIAVGGDPRSVTVGDFNGDGNDDLTIADASGQQGPLVGILIGDGSSSFAPVTKFSAGSEPMYVATGDFNNDGHQDLVTANSGSDNVSILIGDGTGSFIAATHYDVGDHPLSLAVGDFNGDGIQDLAVANEYTDNVSILLGQAATATGSSLLLVDEALQELTDQAAANTAGEDLGGSAPDSSVSTAPADDQEITADVLAQVFEEVGNEF